jgi:flagellar protein FlgJ
MRQADFFIATARPVAPARASTPTVATNGGAAPGAGDFGQVFSQVQNDIISFISHGEAGGFQGGPGAALSPEGRAALERARPSAAAVVAASDDQAGNGHTALQRQFLASIQPWAREAGQRLGVAPEIVAAHAALESGWGQHRLRQSNGADTNNLFSLKAGGAWRGAVALAATTEYEQGAALKKTEQFRSYPDQASAFRDYTDLLLDNPRYRAALHTGSDAQAFAQGLARGGYASDPAYADKLTRLATRLQQASAAAPMLASAANFSRATE